MDYIQSIIKGPLPKTRRITIQKIIIDGIPQIESEGSSIRPYIQIYKNSEIVFNTFTKETPLLSYFLSDISISFDINIQIQGDVLIRCRHLGRDNKPLTIFRTMFHAAFTTEFVIRFSKHDLDGADKDDRFLNEFTMDLFLSENEEAQESDLEGVGLINLKNEKNSRTKEESDEELDDYFKSLENK